MTTQCHISITIPIHNPQIGFKFNTKMMREYISQKSIKNLNAPYSYIESMKSKYSGLRQASPIDVPRDRNSRLKYDGCRDKVAELSRQKNRYQPVDKEYPSSQMGTSKLPSSYQSMFDKKIGVNEHPSATITDRIHLRLKELNKNYSKIPSLAANGIPSGREAIKQVNGNLKGNINQASQLQEQPNASKFDSPIKLLYSESTKQNQIQEQKPVLQQKKEENILIKSKSSIKASLPNDSNRPYQKLSLDRQNNKNVISNVEQILAQIRKTLNK